MKNGGFIAVDKNGYITFIDEGKETAEKIYERHTLLTDWLVGLGVDENTAERDACRLEHSFSSESFEKLKSHIRAFHNKKVVEQK